MYTKCVRVALFGRQAEQPLAGEQHVQGGQHGPARHLHHIGNLEGDVAARFAFRSIDQADGLRADQQARRHAGLAQQALEAQLRRGVPAAGFGRRVQVEIAARFENQQDRSAAVIDHPRGLQEIVITGQWDGEAIRRRGEISHLPTQDIRGESGEVGQLGDRVALAVLRQDCQKRTVQRHEVPVDGGTGFEQRRS